MRVERAHDVVVIGGGPGGSSAATFLARAGLDVALMEREMFPRFHVGESLIPATLSVLERLGLRERIDTRGFQVKYGAQFSDQESDREHTFYFLPGKPWPVYSYQVQRAEFDTILLEHAGKSGARIYQPATVTAVAFDSTGATLTVQEGGSAASLRARFVVDASGRDGFLATRVGQRRRMPNLGKVALFAHFRGAARQRGRDEGNIQIHVFEDGWFWWIPFAGDLTSIGCVMHARTVRGREGALETLYADMISRCARVAQGLARAERVTPVHRVANFSYENRPVVGDRFLAVGDAVAFVDPIFSGGVHVALQSGELAAHAIVAAFADGDFRASRFASYERAVWRGLTPFFRLIHKYYDPSFIALFINPRNYFRMAEAVLTVLAGGAFLSFPWRLRAAMKLLFLLSKLHAWSRRRAGLPVESRLEW
jgi:flavin-dependent dehydrogenase